MSFLHPRDLPPFPQWPLLTTSLALFTAGFLLRGLLIQTPTPGIIPSPRKTLLPRLSKAELESLPYPPDALPGARDVDTPYGNFRVYEFGPSRGRKVLLIHGISTPCIALGGVAHALADKGCRVLLFDLPGRGYSDTPSDLDHDMRLFSAQIFAVLASSELSWTGDGSNGGFSLIGYSLGGGIAASFTGYFPELVRSLVLIAPSGLIRDYHISRMSRMIYAKSTIFEPLLRRIVKGRLMKRVDEPEGKKPDVNESTGAETAVRAEINLEANQQTVLSKLHPEITIASAVNYQVQHHVGFVHAFMSSIRNGPIRGQHELWRKVGRSMVQKGEKVLVVLGRRDPLILEGETREDAENVLEGNVEFVGIEAGHEAPVAKGEEVAARIWEFWEGPR